MAPVKFDDLSKTSKEVLSDDYQVSGYVFKSKQKTSFDGAVLSSQVDLFPAKDSCMTPAKLTWKLPTPLGFSAVCIDKLELDKTGGVKVEASSDLLDKYVKGLKTEAKADVANLSKAVAVCTYNGMKNVQVKVETKAMNPQDGSLEVTYACAPMSGADVTVGLKASMANIASPDLGVRMLYSGVFASLYAKQNFSAYSTSCHYKVADKCRAAATYEIGGKTNGQFSLGVAYDLSSDTKVKAKVAQDMSLSCSVKHAVSKGFTVVAGAKLDAGKMDISSCGLSLSIE